MHKINKFLSKHINLIFLIFIILQPITDVFTGISINFDFLVSPGIIVRVIFMFLFLYYLIFISKCLYRKKALLLLLIIFIYMIIFSLTYPSYYEIASLFKAFYFPIMFIALFIMYDDNNKVNNRYLLFTLFIYIFVIILASITNTAFQSYDIAKTGSVGWFNSANEIGAIIAILLPILFEQTYKKFDLIKLLFLILVVIVSFKLGTRIPLVSLGLCLVIYYIKVMSKLLKLKYKKTFTGVIILSIAILSTFIIMLPKMPIYKNIIIHSKFLKIDSVDDIFRNGETMDHFIFSRRLSYLDDTNSVYVNSDLYNKLFGIGYVKNNKMIEMDIFDIFYRHGVIGFLIYFCSIISMFCFKKIKKFDKFYILPLFLIIFISCFAGHVLVSPAVSIFVVIIILNMLFNEKKGGVIY